MLKKLSLNISKWFEKNEIIEKEKTTVVMWGIYNILNTLFNVVLFLIIGTVFSMLLETIVFTLGYIPLRSFAGGYHAKTPFRCCILSNIILVVALMMIRLGEKCSIILLVTASVCIGILLFLMPVPDIHKPLDNNDKRKYRFIGTVILLIEIMISVIFVLVGKLNIVFSFFSIWILLTIMIIFGKIKNVSYKNTF